METRAPHPVYDNYPMIAVQTADSSQAEVMACTGGAAISLKPGGSAKCIKQGVAFAAKNGTSEAGAAGVAFSRGGHAGAGDGGVAVAHLIGSAAVGAHGVAVSISPGAQRGHVRGALGATLVLLWVVGEAARSKTTVVDGVTIRANLWYSLNDRDEWIEVKGPSLDP